MMINNLPDLAHFQSCHTDWARFVKLFIFHRRVRSNRWLAGNRGVGALLHVYNDDIVQSDEVITAGKYRRP